LLRLAFSSASSRRIVAYAVALLLVFAQQAALTHLIGHLGAGTSAQTIASHEDKGHGEALSLTHACATCVALAALGGPPSARFEQTLATSDNNAVFSTAPIPARFRHFAAYSARAPPNFL
jgi:hypothetical protein